MASAVEQYKAAVETTTAAKWNAQFVDAMKTDLFALNQKIAELEAQEYELFKAAYGEVSQKMNGVTVDVTLMNVATNARQAVWEKLSRDHDRSQRKEVARQTFLKQGGDPEKFDAFWEQAWNERQAEAVKTGIDDPLNIRF
jgi:hypothetical protein